MNWTKYGESIVPEENKEDFGIITEQRVKGIDDGDVYDHLFDVLQDVYGQFQGQYSTLHKKVHEAMDKKLEILAGHYRNHIDELEAKLKNASDEDKSEIEENIREIKSYSKEELDEKMEHMLDSCPSDVNFIEYILQQKTPATSVEPEDFSKEKK